MTLRLSIFSFALAAQVAGAGTWYVDSSVSSSGNGASWSTAWKNVSNISGVSAGDTVYISGGPAGSSRTYTVSYWTPAGGAAGNRITYQIGQDSTHNGTAYFNCSGGTWVFPGNYVVINGDAGDGNMHFALTNAGGIMYSSVSITGVKISYVNGGNALVNLALDVGGSASQFEFDHCYAYVSLSNQNVDHFSNISFGGSTWDDSSAHNNTIYVPNSNTGYGADALQWAGTGFSIYSNTIIGYVGSYTGSQHQDGVQALSGSYIKIYANTFQDLGNSAVDSGPYYGDINHCWIYNNLVLVTYPKQSYMFGFSLESEGKGYMWRDTWIMNNTFVNFNYTYTLHANNMINMAGAEFSGCGAMNNLGVNAESDSTFTVNGVNVQNVIVNSSIATNFVSYVGLPANGTTTGTVPDMHLTTAGNTLLNSGTNLSSFFTMDKDGISRPGSGPWNIGAYRYSATTNAGALQECPPPFSLIVF